MRLIQRKHRHSLRRRVANGEVDLEALGIKRLNVPQEVLDKMPLHIYKAEEPTFSRNVPQSPGDEASPPYTPLNGTTSSGPHMGDNASYGVGRGQAARSNSQQANTIDSSQSFTTTSKGTPSHHVQFAQHTCPICLDDFESNVTQVRELPCGHIFHPECVDVFLRENSSLCPMCKKTVLPLGYCPDTVTNAMVRRERLVRRMRERVTLEVYEEPDYNRPPRSVSVAAGRRMASFHRQFGAGNGRRISSAPNPTSSTMEMTSNPRVAVVEPTETTETIPAQAPTRGDSAARRERGRNRLIVSLGNRRTVEDDDNAREAARPKCESAYRRAVPALNLS
jgi:hypothetical protein